MKAKLLQNGTATAIVHLWMAIAFKAKLLETFAGWHAYLISFWPFKDVYLELVEDSEVLHIALAVFCECFEYKVTEAS